MSVAKIYAKALYEAARGHALDSSGLDRLEKELGQFLKLATENESLKTVLFTPATTSNEKMNVLGELMPRLDLSRLASNFLVLLATKGRFSFLEQTLSAFKELRLVSAGGISGALITAEPLAEDDVRTLAGAFEKKLGKKVVFSTRVDPSVLAGIRVTINGVTYDGTLKAQLMRLKDYFVFQSEGIHV